MHPKVSYVDDEQLIGKKAYHKELVGIASKKSEFQ